MDYQKFREDFESSGLTQRAYGEQVSMSASMVHYYLKKTAASALAFQRAKGFTPLKIKVEASSERAIHITTPTGMKITIPI